MKHHPKHPLDREIKQVLDGLDMSFQPDDWLLMEQKLDNLPNNLDTPTDTTTAHPVDNGVKQVLEGFNMPFKEADWQLMEEKLNNVPIDAENHPIDEIVKGALNRADMPFQEADWQLMEQKLDTPQTSIPANLRNYWQYLAAAVVLLALLYGIKDFLPSSVQDNTAAHTADHYTGQTTNNSTFVNKEQSGDAVMPSKHNSSDKQLQNSAAKEVKSTIEQEKNATKPSIAATTPVAKASTLGTTKKANTASTKLPALSPKQNRLLTNQTTKSTTTDKHNDHIESKITKNQINSNNNQWAISTTPSHATTRTTENINTKVVDIVVPVQSNTSTVNHSTLEKTVVKEAAPANQPIIQTPATSTAIENNHKIVGHPAPTSLDQPFTSKAINENVDQSIDQNQGNNDVVEQLAIAQNKTADQVEATAKTIQDQNNTSNDPISSNSIDAAPEMVKQPIISSLPGIPPTTLAVAPNQLEPRSTKIATAYSITLLAEEPLDEENEIPDDAEANMSLPIPAPEVPRNSLNDITKVGSHTSVDGNLADLYNTPNLSYTSGLSANWQVSSLWSLETGAFFTRKTFTTNQYIPNTRRNEDLLFADTALSPNATVDNNSNSNKKTMQGNWLAVEVPALVKLHLRPEKKLNWYIGTGISAYLPLKEKFTTVTNYSTLVKNSLTYNQSGFDANPFDTDRIVVINTNPSDVYTPAPSPNDSSFDSENMDDLDNINNLTPVDDFIEDIHNYVNTNESVGYQLQLDETYNVIGTNTVNPTKPYFDILNLHLGFNYQVSKKVYIQMNTNVKTSITKHVFNRSLKGVYQNQKRRLTTFGLQGGVLINL